MNGAVSAREVGGTIRPQQTDNLTYFMQIQTDQPAQALTSKIEHLQID